MSALKYSLFSKWLHARCFESCNRCQLLSSQHARPLLLTTINRNLKRIKSEGDSDERDDVVQNKDSINQICALRPPTHTDACECKTLAAFAIKFIYSPSSGGAACLAPSGSPLSLAHFYRGENLLFAHRNANKMKF